METMSDTVSNGRARIDLNTWWIQKIIGFSTPNPPMKEKKEKRMMKELVQFKATAKGNLTAIIA